MAVRVLIAPDSFKSTLTAFEAAAIIAGAARDVLPGAWVEECPLGDGGEGTLEVWSRAVGADVTSVPSRGVLGAPIDSPVARRPDTGEVMVEAAHTCGLPPPGLRDPRRTSTFGLGLALGGVLRAFPGARIRVALGGTGTVDGGLGAALALGLQVDGVPPSPAPRSVLELPAALRLTFDSPFRHPPVFLCDTRAPLLGPRGAAAVFGPQKGVGADEVEAWDAALGRLVTAAAASTGATFADRPGFGAAGGVSALFHLLAAADLVSGASFIMESVGFPGKVEAADLVVTGEGCLDDTSFSGKVVGAVAEVCRRARRPLLVLPGRSRLDPTRIPPGVAVRPATGPGEGVPEKNGAGQSLAAIARSAFRDFLKKQLFPADNLR